MTARVPPVTFTFQERGGFLLMAMPNRIIREGWIESPRIDQLDAQTERFFLRLCLRADDFGRYHALPQLLRSNLFPLREDVRAADIPRWLAACEKAGLLACYESDGKPYLVISKFDQRTRAEKSRFPDPPSNVSHLTVIRQTDDRHPRTETETETETYVGKTNAREKPAPTSDSEWLASLSTNPAYSGLNIGAEYGKMAAWCGANHKPPTRRRFINWLNRCERPMPRAVTIPHTATETAPQGWQATLARLRPGNTYEGAWTALPDSIKAEVRRSG